MTKQECIRYVNSHLEFVPAKNNGAYTCGRMLKPNGSVNHSIGCAQPRAAVIYNSMNKSTAGWGVSAILGDFHLGEGVIKMALRWDPANKECSRNWGVGSGSKGSWNNSRIQWEVCEPAGHTYAGGTMIGYDVAKNQEFFDRMWKLLVAWNVYICVTFGFDPNMIGDHAESYKAGMGCNHGDMAQWLPKHGKSMDCLRREVQDILDGKEEDEEMCTYEQWLAFQQQYEKEQQDNDAGDWSAASRKWAIETGLVKGRGDGNYAWEASLTREEMCELLYRYQDRVNVMVNDAVRSAIAAELPNAVAATVKEALAAASQQSTQAPTE